jgi:hypothetical protein
MEKWSVELGRFHIEYLPRTSIKGQVVADLIAEFTEPAEVLIDPVLTNHPKKLQSFQWLLTLKCQQPMRGNHTLTTAMRSQQTKSAINS